MLLLLGNTRPVPNRRALVILSIFQPGTITSAASPTITLILCCTIIALAHLPLVRSPINPLYHRTDTRLMSLIHTNVIKEGTISFPLPNRPSIKFLEKMWSRTLLNKRKSMRTSRKNGKKPHLRNGLLVQMVRVFGCRQFYNIGMTLFSRISRVVCQIARLGTCLHTSLAVGMAHHF
jgi:hypothetical protein